jgi:hypothetical protein
MMNDYRYNQLLHHSISFAFRHKKIIFNRNDNLDIFNTSQAKMIAEYPNLQTELERNYRRLYTIKYQDNDEDEDNDDEEGEEL